MANLTKQSLHLSPGLRSANLVTTGGDMTINSRRMRVNDVELNVVVQGQPAMPVAHPAAYASCAVAPKLTAHYVFCIQLRGLNEFLVRRFEWWLFGVVLHYPPEFRHMRARLSRSGRLTAGFNYYRANLHLMLSKAFPRVKVPVVGIWSDGDVFLTEDQMRASERYCDAGFRYVRIDGANHWLQLTAPEKLNPLLLQLLR